MFSINLKIARKRNGYTLEQLANEYNRRFGGGMSKGTLSKYENGKQEPMITVVINLANLLNVSVDFLVNAIPDNTNKLLSDKLGLSKKSIDVLSLINDNELSDALNCLLENGNFMRFMQLFSQYKKEFKNQETAIKAYNNFCLQIGQHNKLIYSIDNVEDYEHLIYNNLHRCFEMLIERLNFSTPHFGKEQVENERYY
ncbi:MAG: helix-turn-helix transcriptional regulator [Ruminococcus sp.]|nr:helix-turn-helix transcriptional regulator [Ruminococcus sp.]MDD6710071.1 helix-turn-helix transcriptional regulator [Ruminococcus sp.]